MDRKCCTCHSSKAEEEFPVRKNTKCGRGSKCLECQRSYHKQYYVQNATATKARVVRHNKGYMQRNRQHVWDYLKSHPCVQCGETNPVLLEFDHLSDKSYCVSVMSRCGYSTDRIDKEIKKCQVLCVKCHRLKTAEQLGWYKGLV